MVESKYTQPSKGEKAFWYAGFAAILLAALFALYFFYLIFWPIKVVEIKSPMDLPVKDKTLTVKDIIAFEYDYCKHIDSRPRVVKEIISQNNVITVSPIGSDVPQLRPGCGKVIIYHEIPDFTPPGKYRLYIFASYPVNQFRNIDYTFRTQEFTIVPIDSENDSIASEENTETGEGQTIFGGGGTSTDLPVAPFMPPSREVFRETNTTNTIIQPTPQPQPTPTPNPGLIPGLIDRIL